MKQKPNDAFQVIVQAQSKMMCLSTLNIYLG